MTGPTFHQHAPPGTAPPRARHSRFGLLSVASGTLGFLAGIFCYPLGMLLPVLGLLFGALSLHMVRQRPETYRGKRLGKVGLWLSVLGVATHVYVTYLLFTSSTAGPKIFYYTYWLGQLWS